MEVSYGLLAETCKAAMSWCTEVYILPHESITQPTLGLTFFVLEEALDSENDINLLRLLSTPSRICQIELASYSTMTTRMKDGVLRSILVRYAGGSSRTSYLVPFSLHPKLNTARWVREHLVRHSSAHDSTRQKPDCIVDDILSSIYEGRVVRASSLSVPSL